MLCTKTVKIILAVVMLLAVIACEREKAPPAQEGREESGNLSRRLAVVSDAFLSPAMEEKRQASHAHTVEFAQQGKGIAYIEPHEGKFRVVHNGKAGRSYLDISELLLSSDGNRVAYVARINAKTYRTVVDGREGRPFGADDNHWFTPDGKHYIATVTEGTRKHIVVDNTIIRTLAIADVPVIGPDSNSLAFSTTEPDGQGRQFVITDLGLQNRTAFDSCGDFILPGMDAQYFAVGCSGGGARSVKVIDVQKRAVIAEHVIDGDLTHMKFAPGGGSIAYTVVRPGLQRFVVYKGREEKIPEGDEFMTDPVVLSAQEAVGVVIGDVYKTRLYKAFQGRNKSGKEYGYISDLVASGDGRHAAYIATNQGERQMHIVVDGHEGPKFDKIVSPLFSPDGRVVAYRARQEGKRFLVVSDLRGRVLRSHREYDMVFPPSFLDGGKEIAYGVLDGKELWWIVEKVP